MEDLEGQTTKIAKWRILPPLFFALLLMQFDRLNVGFAALQMNKELSFNPEVFGFGVGLFFIGYALFGVPSNLILHRAGAAVWISVIMVAWGVTASAMAFVTGATSFYLTRFVLGLTEAGFTPGALYFTSLWFTRRNLAAATATWGTGVPFAGVIIGPISTTLMSMHIFGIAGWRLMFLVEGIPAILLGLTISTLLPTPETAAWLPRRNLEWLQATLKIENSASANVRRCDFFSSIRSREVWVYAVTFFLFTTGILSLLFWLPQLIKLDFATISDTKVGMLSVIPALLGTVGLLLAGWNSDRTGDRRWHIASLGILAATMLFVSMVIANPVAKFLLLSFASACSLSYLAVFWSVPMAALKGTAAAGGIAFINSIGLAGGFAGPYIFGLAATHYGSITSGVAISACVLLISGMLPIIFKHMFPKAIRTGVLDTT